MDMIMDQEVADHGQDPLMVDHEMMDHGIQGTCTLSASRELILAIVPIPSAILSVLGSAIILFMVRNQNRRKGKFSPYTRLLVCMSVCDIVLSISLSVATFARPKETSPRLYSFGNSATCSTVGFLNQMFFANVWYQAMLSTYFLLTTRFGFSNKFIRKKIEPWMHFVALGYSLVAALVTLGMGAFGESSTMLGCWLGNPNNCSEGLDAKVCPSVLMGYFWLMIPLILAFVVVSFNNLAILAFVHKQMSHLRVIKSSDFPDFDGGSDHSQSLSASKETPSENEETQLGDPEVRSSAEEEQRSHDQLSQVSRQQRRLKLVSSQSFLFVASFFLCNVWTFVGARFESVGTDASEMKIHYKFFPILVCQAFFAPLQGLLNMVVYLRPKYLALRHQHPGKSRRWIIRSVICGEDKKQKPAGSEKVQEPLELRTPHAKLPHGDMVSSLTNGDSDFVHHGDRWIDTSGDNTQEPAVAIRFHSETKISQLEVISEIEEFTFSPVETMDPIRRPLSPDVRWSNNEASSASVSLSLPQRVESELEFAMSPLEGGTRKLLQIAEPASFRDLPIRIPKRGSSPTRT